MKAEGCHFSAHSHNSSGTALSLYLKNTDTCTNTSMLTQYMCLPIFRYAPDSTYSKLSNETYSISDAFEPLRPVHRMDSLLSWCHVQLHCLSSSSVVLNSQGKRILLWAKRKSDIALHLQTWILLQSCTHYCICTTLKHVLVLLAFYTHSTAEYNFPLAKT